MRVRMAHLRRLERVIIVRVSQTHKYNDLPLSKLPAPSEIKGVPPGLAMVWGGGWREVLHLGCSLWNSNADTHLPTPGSHIVLCLPRSSPGSRGLAASARAAGRRWVGAAAAVTSAGIPAIIFSQETRMCLKVRLMLI